MMRSTVIANASLVAGIAAVGLVSTAAAEPRTSVMQVISSNATSRFVPLGVGKSVVIDLPTDIAEVLVTDPKLANVVVRSARRAYIIGMDVGQTNIYFFDADGRQIGGLDIAVSKDPQLTPPLLANSGITGIAVEVVRGSELLVYTCTRTTCTQPAPPEAAPSGPTINFISNSTVSTAPAAPAAAAPSRP